MRKLTGLKVGVAPIALGIAMLATPALAQDEVGGEEAAEAEEKTEIVVTGSIFRRTNVETASPITVLSAETLEERGINTVADAVQLLPSNNAGTITQGWNTGFNFATGANAPALRGLTVQSTLSIADGIRLAPYPLADDGQRNFVDLNTIPDAIVDRVEILRDGASSSYGADAIAGVVNIITKKEIQGLHLGASFGVSEEGDAEEERFDVTWGHGDLDEDGFNFYVSAEYQHNDELRARDRGYPFNTSDWSEICGPSGSCLPNHNLNGITAEDDSYFGFFDIYGVALARPVTTAGDTTGSGRYEFLNPGAGCRNWDPIVLTPAQLAQSSSSPTTTCELNIQNEYQFLRPDTERKGLAARLTFNVGDRAQVYAIGNYYDIQTDVSFTPLNFRGTPTPPRGADVGSYNVIAPIYVCAAGVGTLNGLNTGCDATNGVLNPYNPYAADGQTAQISFRSPRPRAVKTDARSLRGVLGIDGEFGDNWQYSAKFTASEVRLNRTQENYLIPQRIADVLAQGTFNFYEPSETPEAVWDYIAPTNRVTSLSKLYQAEATLAKELFELPGGSLLAAAGLSYRDESIDAPSANPGIVSPSENEYDRYYSVNSVGTAGSRNVWSAFYEIEAPVLDTLELSASGRYDDYSTGQSRFSPKFGFKYNPVPELALRGTWSKGFRIPSFNEAFGLPTTGYVTQAVNCGTDAEPGPQADFCRAHSPDGTIANANSYATGDYNVGLTSVGNPELDPEKSTSYTLGAIFEPTRNLSFTIDYWRIKVRDLIGPPGGQGTAIAQYYANNGSVSQDGYTAIAGNPDPEYPNALPLIGFLQSSFVNQDSQIVSGLDFGANLTVPIGSNLTFRSNAQASYLFKYQVTRQDGTVERYEGTLSPCNVTSCSGAPEWRGTWQNSLDIGEDTTLTFTTYYTDGYDTASVDFGGIPGDCEFNAANSVSTATYVDGTPVNCSQPAQWNVDFNAKQKIGDKFTILLDIQNVFDIGPKFDPSAAYGLFGFNPAWGGPNILGRYFRLGAKVDF